MKRCPVCNKSYVDESLSFCINDGTPLVRDSSSSNLESQPTTILGEPPPTVIMRPPLPTDNVQRSPHAPAPPQPYSWAQDEPQVWRPPVPPAPYTRAPSQSQTLAVVSLVFGLVSISFGWICGGPLFALIAIVLGFVALMQIRKNPAQYGGKPAAIGGLITGSLVLLVNLALFAIWIVMMIIGSA